LQLTLQLGLAKHGAKGANKRGGKTGPTKKTTTKKRLGDVGGCSIYVWQTTKKTEGRGGGKKEREMQETKEGMQSEGKRDRVARGALGGAPGKERRKKKNAWGLTRGG